MNSNSNPYNVNQENYNISHNGRNNQPGNYHRLAEHESDDHEMNNNYNYNNPNYNTTENNANHYPNTGLTADDCVPQGSTGQVGLSDNMKNGMIFMTLLCVFLFFVILLVK